MKVHQQRFLYRTLLCSLSANAERVLSWF